MLKPYLKSLGDILFPRICFFCEQRISGGFLCLKCEAKIEFLNGYLCTFCLKPLAGSQNTCKTCPEILQSLDTVISTAAYKEPLITLIHHFKYKKYSYLDDFLSQLMKKHLLRVGFDWPRYNLITTVPLHRLKLKERGYNQAGLLGQCLSNYFRIPLRDDIIINTDTRPPQAKLSQEQRDLNVKGLFRVEKNLKNKGIILVDDTLTTGATVRACSKALKEKGADKVAVITLAKTLYNENTS